MSNLTTGKAPLRWRMLPTVSGAGVSATVPGNAALAAGTQGEAIGGQADKDIPAGHDDAPQKAAAPPAPAPAPADRTRILTAMNVSIRQGLLLFLMLASPLLASVVGLGLWGAWRSQEIVQRVFVEEVAPTQDLIRIDRQIARVRV
ncbi:MAG: Tar ligand binding domain-containing protein, partial [Candidatus Accumulibacter sp.]|nr:Tar ligand binding domain-containing protein [Accumulibacter sp.]